MPYFIEEKLRILRLDNESQFDVSHRHINVYLNLSVICLFYASSGVNNLCGLRINTHILGMAWADNRQ